MINTEYLNWKNDGTGMGSGMGNLQKYDTMLYIPFEMETTAVQWLPIKNIKDEHDYNCYKLLLALHCPLKNESYLCMAEINLPSEERVIDLPQQLRKETHPCSQSSLLTSHQSNQSTKNHLQPMEFNNDSDIVKNYSFVNNVQMPHNGKINRMKYMYQKYS